MKLEVIPAINADSFEEVARRIKLVELYVKWVQLDIADGTFTKNTTWHNPQDLLGFETPLKIEVHLMISDIEERLEEWLLAPVQRIIFHLETAKDPDFVIEKCREVKKEVGIAIGPDTPWTQLVPFLKKVDPVRSPHQRCGSRRRQLASNGVDLIQILGVYPGLAGQKFQEESLDKITHLRKKCPQCIIEVDGGMDAITAKKAVEAGANIIVAASAIFDAEDIKKAIEELKNV